MCPFTDNMCVLLLQATQRRPGRMEEALEDRDRMTSQQALCDPAQKAGKPLRISSLKVPAAPALLAAHISLCCTAALQLVQHGGFSRRSWLFLLCIKWKCSISVFSSYFFFLLLFSSPIITQQANTGVRFNGFWGSLPVCHLLNSLVIVFHMLPWKRSNQALSVCLYPRPATRHALSRSLPFPVCLRLQAAFSVCQNRGAVWCMRTNLNFLREPPHTIKPIMLCTQKSYRKFNTSRLALSIKPCAPSHQH